jgi:hypothetical protein
MAAPVGLVEVGEGGVGLLGPAARGPEDLAGERGEAGRELDLRPGLPRRQGLGSPLSQYDRAAEAPVAVSRYSVMLSRMWSRVSPPDGCPPVKAREILP